MERTVIMAAGVVPRLANRIQLDAQLDEQRQREYEALVGVRQHHTYLCRPVNLAISITSVRRRSFSGFLSTSTRRKSKQLINAYRYKLTSRIYRYCEILTGLPQEVFNSLATHRR